MVRWQPGAKLRLQAAALELYASKGFEETTVTEIALAAGLTERTFFRHFQDKREVLFGGHNAFQEPYLSGVATAAAQLSPLEVVISAIVGAADFFPEERRAYARQRQLVIDANPGLQERELLKLAALATALADALRNRGVADPGATLAAESGVTVFRVSFAEWISENSIEPLEQIERRIFGELFSLTAPGRAGAR
ncbi:MAG: TetR family transcriptional regulator [Glaciihabitans sp.]|nr:TetR family transcriptional regulator [Glaciihabitans sp.]